MAGGYGLKLWPKSTDTLPKQFNHLYGDGTMIQETISRLKNILPLSDIYVVTKEKYKDIIREQVPKMPEENIILEPFGRNTAPALALALIKLQAKCKEDTIMMAFPSDHIIGNVREFNTSIDLACKTAYDRKGIVIIGLEPTRADTQFGYVQISDQPRDLGDLFIEGVRYSTTFAEKPDIGTARRFVESGEFLWNSGIFIWRMDTFRNALQNLLPDLYKHFEYLAQYLDTEDYQEQLVNVYRRIERISIDYGILEKSNEVYVVSASFSWTDLETWDEVYRICMKDAKNNVIQGDVIALDTSNSYIYSHGKIVCVAGVDNLIVVQTEDGILICKKNESEKVQDLVNYMLRKHINNQKLDA